MHDRMKYKNRKMDTFLNWNSIKIGQKIDEKKMPLIEIFHTLIDSTATIILMFRISLSPFILFFFCSIQIIDQVTMREKEKKFNFFNEKKNFFDWFTSKLKTFKPHKMCVCVCECCLWWWWWCIMWIWLCDFFLVVFQLKFHQYHQQHQDHSWIFVNLGKKRNWYLSIIHNTQLHTHREKDTAWCLLFTFKKLID